MNRTELQRLSNLRLEDGQALLAVSRWSGAYYLLGYSLECALKSCVLAYIERTGIIFEDRRYAERCWTHDIDTLVSQAGLMEERGRAAAASPRFGAFWDVATNWSEAARYRVTTQLEAEKLDEALTDSTEGVLPWIRTRW